MHSAPTIEGVKALQRTFGLADVHVCWLGPLGFVLAHTDEEREGGHLTDCDLHSWLRLRSEPPPEGVGYYIVVPHEGDADRFDFHPLEGWVGP